MTAINTSFAYGHGRHSENDEDVVVGKLYSFSSNTQSRKMPLPGRSNRTFMLDVPNALISDRRVPARRS
jgi:hypothetical protein